MSGGTWRKVPPVRNAAWSAVNFVRSGRDELMEVGLDELGMRRGGLVEAAEPDAAVRRASALRWVDNTVEFRWICRPGSLASDARGGEDPRAG